MGRERADVLAASPKPRGRDAVWAAIRAQKMFSVRDLREATDVPPRTIRDYVAALCAGGLCRRLEEPDARGEIQYELLRDAGLEAPRLRADGSPVTQGLRNERLWRTMRMLREFSVDELKLGASTRTDTVSLSLASRYVTTLHDAGYLIVTRERGNTTPAIYRLVRDTGPLPPQLQTVRRIFDPNKGRVMGAESWGEME